MKKLLKRNKLLTILLLLTIIAFILGIIFHATLKEEELEIIKNNIDKITTTYPEKYLNNVISLNLTTLLIWVLGISIIGIIIVIILYLFKVFILSFELISFFKALKYTKYIKIVLLFLPKILNIILLFILTYFSIYYSLCIFKHIFLNKKQDFKFITKKYIKILIISIFLNIVISTIKYLLILPMLKIKY